MDALRKARNDEYRSCSQAAAGLNHAADRRNLRGCGAIHHLGHCPLPSYREVVDILADLREILYPATAAGRICNTANVADHVGTLVDSLHERLSEQIARAFRYDCEAGDDGANPLAKAEGIVIRFLDEAPRNQADAG